MQLTVALLMLVLTASGQTWLSRYNGDANDEDQPYGVAADGAGGVYVTGSSWGTGTAYDFATIKYGPAGESLWAARYDGPSHTDDAARAIAVRGGRVIVTGGRTADNALTDFLTVAYDTAGALQWGVLYDGPAAGNDHGLAVAADGSGNVYSGGYASGDTTGWDFAVVKYDAGGGFQWAGRYVTADEDYAVAVATDGSNNVYAAGSSGSPYTLSWDYVTARFDPGTGDTLWVRRFNGSANDDDEVRAMAIDNSGNVIVAGGGTGSASGVDYTTVKYSPDGDTLWVRYYNGPANGTDWANALAVDLAGNVYVTGSCQDTATDMDYVTVKYDANGNQQWVARYDGPSHSFDEARGIAVDDAGNAYVTGGSTGSGTRSDYATVKYDAAGGEVRVNRYDGPASRLDEAIAIVLDGTGGVCVTGGSAGSGTGTDYATARYPFVGIEETPNGEVPMANRDPSIVRGVLWLLPASGVKPQASSSLMDIAGRKVLDLRLGANDVSRLAPGIYFVRQASDIRRVVLAD